MSMAEKLKRISVAVDAETDDKLREIAKKENKTVSEIIRKAITVYSEFDLEKNIPPEKTKIYAELLYGREHVIVDIELWVAMLDELNKSASDEFWQMVEKIGYEHGIQYRMKGITNILKVFGHMENENLFRIKTTGNVYTLILSTRSEQKILKSFFKGMLKALDVKAEIVEGLRKLIIVIQEDDSMKKEKTIGEAVQMT